MHPISHKILSNYDEKVVQLGIALHTFLLQHLPQIMELPDESANMIGFGYGLGYKDTICTLIPSKKGIKVGFYKGSQLPDPSKLLTGLGKVHRHVEIKSVQDIHNPALLTLVKEALAAYSERNGTIH